MMTPLERFRSLARARTFLQEIIDGDYPSLPAHMKERAKIIFENYPGPYQLRRIAEKSPELLYAED
jgi:hypothetical protein